VPVVQVAPETVVHVLATQVNELLAADLYNRPPETEPAVVACVARVASVAKVAKPADPAEVASPALVAVSALVAKVALVANPALVAEEAKVALVAEPALVAVVAKVAKVAKVARVARVAVVAKVAKVAVVANVAIVAEPAAMLDWLSHEGAAVPLDVRTWVTVPAAVYACAVPVPYPTPPFVGVAVEFVPPLATGKVPDTSAVKDTAPHVGAPEELPCSTWVEVPANVVAIAVVVEP